jgi:Zn-dependent protease
MNFLGGSIPVGRLFGVRIRVHILFVVWIGYVLLTAGDAWRSELLFLGTLFGTVLCHELGHCFGARAVGGRAEDIMMWPLGGLAYASAPMQPWPQFVTVACGPLVNLLFCIAAGATLLGYGVFGLSTMPAGVPNWVHGVITIFFINAMLLGFNLLPIFPLDGGQLFRVLLWKFMGLHRATIIAAQVGVAGAVLMAVAGIAFSQFILIFIAIFGGMISWQHYQAARHGWAAEQLLRAQAVVTRKRRPVSLWSRLSGRQTRQSEPPPLPAEALAPSPQDEETQRAADEAELERLRKKVAEQGPHSLTYVEEQRLGRIAAKLHSAGESSDQTPANQARGTTNGRGTGGTAHG